MTVLDEIKEVTTVSESSPRAALQTVSDLFEALHQRGIRYCHWKSNLRLDWGLSGRTDLDLLVDPKDEAAFKSILSKYNVKLVVARKGKQYPDVHHYLGFDHTSGRLFHLHVHYRLVLGEQFVKNYHLPLEDEFLASVRICQGVNIPGPELELSILSMRALLKYRDRDALKDILSIRSAGLPSHILDEIHWLLAQTSLERVSQVLDGIGHHVPKDAILSFLGTIAATPRDGLTLVRLRGQVRRALQAYQRHDRFRATIQYFREAWQRRKTFLKYQPEKKMTLPAGGVTLALIGVDGSGKTTQSKELTRWLNWKMDAHLYYLGSKQPSRLSRMIYLGFRMSRRAHRAIARRFGEESFVARRVEAIRQTLLYTHYLSIGYDRYRRYMLGKQDAQGGSIVIFDRFPLEYPLDGPKIPLAAKEGPGMLTGFFSRLERGLYHKFEMPDHLFLLGVSPEESLRRKPDHQPETIKAKNMALRSLWADPESERPNQDWLLLNANPPLEVVLNRLKTVIWAAAIPNYHDY